MMLNKIILPLISIINLLIVTSIATDEKLVQINPSFTEITPRVLPLRYSDREILWKRLSDKKEEMMIVVKRASSVSSSDDNFSPPHRLVRHGSRESIDALADDFQKKLSISPPRNQFIRQKSISLPNSPRRPIGLPPRSPNRSATSSPKAGSEPFSGRRRTSSKLSMESHGPATVTKQERHKGFSCTCSRPNGRCGC